MCACVHTHTGMISIKKVKSLGKANEADRTSEEGLYKAAGSLFPRFCANVALDMNYVIS